MTDAEVRSLITWHNEYRPEWDLTPEMYVEHDIVGWGKSRRLGLLKVGRYKAYIGVQHVDPDRPGWRVVDEPTARFFTSLFVDGACITLRTFRTMGETVGMLALAVASPPGRDLT